VNEEGIDDALLADGGFVEDDTIVINCFGEGLAGEAIDELAVVAVGVGASKNGGGSLGRMSKAVAGENKVADVATDFGEGEPKE